MSTPIDATIVQVDADEILLVTDTVLEILSVSEQGIVGPQGATGLRGLAGVNGTNGISGTATAIGGKDILITALQAGDLLSYDATNWVNKKQELISDGGNF